MARQLLHGSGASSYALLPFSDTLLQRFAESVNPVGKGYRYQATGIRSVVC
jgi:hypothetical protein